MRHLPKILSGILAGLFITAPLLAILYFADQAAGLPFVPFDLFDWIARTLPGDVITKGIDTMVNLIMELNLGETSSTAKTLETLSALAAFLGGGVVVGAIMYWVLDWLSTGSGAKLVNNYMLGAIGGFLFGLPLILISLDVNVTADTSDTVSVIWLAIAFITWGIALNWFYKALPKPVETPNAASVFTADEAVPAAALPIETEQISRRQFLIRVGGATAALTVMGAGVGRYLEWRDDENYRKLIARRRAQAALIADELPNAGDPVEPAPGTRPELTPLEDHYRIDINVRPAEQDEDTWRLNITGLVDNPLELSINDLRDGYDPLHQYVTLACISNPVGGDLTSTILWTGVRLSDVLADAGLQDGARYAQIHGADGFYETMDLALLDEDDRIMLAYSWEGIPLLHKHGFPLRIYIPDRYGMKQPKWITDIEITSDYREGYWVERGWDETARMRATSVVDVAASDRTFERDGQIYVPVGGIAHAGKRGISKVEVQVDDGDWVEAQLREPLSETTWVIWRYDWPFDDGEHVFHVRCYEGDGAPQIEDRAHARPSGATGYHRRTADI